MRSRNLQRIKRHNRLRNKITGTSERPRLSIFRSNQRIYVQVINDTIGKTLVGMHSSGKSIADITAFGAAFADAMKKQKITSVVFDRGGYLYHGKVKAFADAVRNGGVNF